MCNIIIMHFSMERADSESAADIAPLDWLSKRKPIQNRNVIRPVVDTPKVNIPKRLPSTQPAST